MRMGINPAGQAMAALSGAPGVRMAVPAVRGRPLFFDSYFGQVSGWNAPPRGTALPLLSLGHEGCRALLAEAESWRDAINAQPGETWPKMHKEFGLLADALQRLNAACGTHYGYYNQSTNDDRVAYIGITDAWGRLDRGSPSSQANIIGVAQTNNPYQYVAPNSAAVDITKAGVTLGPVGFVKAAGQVVVGESPNAMSAIVGLAMIGGAGYLGYYLGKRSKRKNRR